MLTVTVVASYDIPASHDDDADALVRRALEQAHATFPGALDVDAYDIDAGPSSTSRGAHTLELEITHERYEALVRDLGALIVSGTSDAGAFALKSVMTRTQS